MRKIAVVLFWCAAWAACGDRQRPAPADPELPGPARREERGPDPDRDRSRPDTGAPDLSPLQQPLAAEAREQDPRSARVRLKLFVQPVEAEVFWGRKRLGVAGRQPLELERSRSSGPVDLVLRAPGFLPFHTRLYTDRDDALTVRLVSPAQARGLLGWKPGSPSGAQPGPAR